MRIESGDRDVGVGDIRCHVAVEAKGAVFESVWDVRPIATTTAIPAGEIDAPQL